MNDNTNKDTYFIARYSLIREPQMTIDEILNNQTNPEIFMSWLNSIQKSTHITANLKGCEFKFYYSKAISENSYLLKFSKKTNELLNEASETDITPKQVDNYPFSYIIIDTTRQLFLIQKNSDISSSVITLKNHIANAISHFLIRNNITIKLELMTEKSKFWDTIKKYNGEISSVELYLISPNFLGQSYSSTKMMESFRESTNSESVKFTLNNEQGKLIVDQDNIFFKDGIEYIANGCGKWRIKVSGKGYSKITSDDSPLEETLDKEIWKLTAEQLESLGNLFKRIDYLENDNHKKE